VVLEKAHWWLPRRRCGCCQKITTAAAPWAQAGSVVYGPDINAAAVLLSSEGNVPAGRTAALMEALLGTPVSSGFAARALARLADRLRAAGFDEAMKNALRAEDVLCGDETVRHEAPCDRAEVKRLRRPAVAAAGLKLRAA